MAAEPQSQPSWRDWSDTFYRVVGYPPSSLKGLHDDLDTVQVELRQIKAVVNGSPETDTKGLRQRVEALEKLAEDLKTIPILVKGITIGLAFTGFGTAASLVIQIAGLIVKKGP